MFRGIDFYSDTLTKPTPQMRRAMVEAEVGDEQKGEDPTTLKLEEKVAELLGHSSALFFPSATMANEIALQLLAERGDELIAAADCHLFFAETGGPAIHAGLMTKPVKTPNGIFTGEDVRDNFRTNIGSHYPVTRIVSVENTTNMGGGVVWPQATLDDVLKTAKELALKTHLDGARLANAVVASRSTFRAIASRFDTATLCLSKGLGCPTGAVLAFNKEMFVRARRLKQLMGGALRQSGILAAAGIYALENHVARLEDDHQNARKLAEGLSEIKGLVVETKTPSTNMVFFSWLSNHPADAINELCMKRGVRFSAVGPKRLRACTHLDISTEDVTRALKVMGEIAKEI